jgi:hypothetical protein
MRAPDHRIDKLDDKPAIEEANRHLRPLFFEVFSWSEDPSNIAPKKKFGASMRLVEGVLAEAEYALNEADGALNEAVKCKRAKGAIARAKEAIAGVTPFIRLARETAIPFLGRAQPPKGPRGQRRDLNASRDQRIAKTVLLIRERFELSQERASSVVSEALKSLVLERRRAFKLLIKKGADPAWIEERQEFIDKLWLSEDRVEDIAKQNRT